MNSLPLQRTDTRWHNEFNSFGTNADPVARTIFGGSARIGRVELESLHRHDWTSRTIVGAMGDDATREWMTLVEEEGGDGGGADELSDALEELRLKDKMHELIELSRLYGGAIMVMGVYDGQTIDQPLNEDRVSWFGFLLVLDRWQVFPQDWYRDPSHPKFGLPSHYILMPVVQGGSTVQNVIVHESRVIRMDGGYIPVRQRLRNVGWGDSVLEPVYEAVRQFGICTQSGAALLEDFVTKIFKMADLPEKIGSGKISLVQDRMRLAAGQMSVHGTALIGPDDELTRLGTPIQGLSKMHEQYVDYMSGAGRMPKSRLFGNQSGMLGASAADADLRTWYDQVAAFQKNQVDERIKRIARLKAKADGLAEEGWDVKWNSLWQMDDITQSQVMVNYSQAHSNWVQAGILQPEEIAESVFGQDGINFEDITLDPVLREKIEKQEEEADLMNQLMMQKGLEEGEEENGPGKEIVE